MPSVLRQKRVADRLQQEISQFIQLEMNDPRLALVTVTRVNIDRELEYANIFVSTVGEAERRKEVLQVLNKAKGLIRREVARRVQLRRAPELIFHWDPAPEKAEQLSQLPDEIRAAENPPGEAPDPPASQDEPAPDTGDDDADAAS
jgi:ribosome-binding factor A